GVAGSDQDLRRGEPATPRQRLAQLLDHPREELAVFVVPRQAADNQGAPGPDGLPRLIGPRARFVPAGWPAAPCEMRHAGCGEVRRYPPRPAPGELVRSPHESTYPVHPFGTDTH